MIQFFMCSGGYPRNICVIFVSFLCVVKWDEEPGGAHLAPRRQIIPDVIYSKNLFWIRFEDSFEDEKRFPGILLVDFSEVKGT